MTGVIGEGKMGTNLFHYITEQGIPVKWLCSETADTEKLMKGFLRRINRSKESEIISPEIFEELSGKTEISKNPEILSQCGLVIEAVTEDLPVKRDLFSKIDRFLPADCILASNSSSINPSELIVSEKRTSSTIGIHFFYPVQLKNIAEIITTDSTSGEVRSASKAFLESINREYIILNEKNGFILNRIFLDVQNEAFLAAKEGDIPFEQADAIVQAAMFPDGIFGFMDSVGLDTMLASIRNYTRDYPHRDFFVPLMNVLEQLIRSGRTGKKSGAGFFAYSGEKENAPTHESSLEVIREFESRVKLAYISSLKRFAMQSHINISDLDRFMTEYLGAEKSIFLA
jgi:3-hydroxybutyryl-CoA dehydrogenase